ncbi:CKLF-like MARVEL transmembrane domain-containing protein 6 [Tachysurus ichikawai]
MLTSCSSCFVLQDFGYSVLISVFLFIASITFTASNSGSEVERATVAFGFLAFFAFVVDVILFYKTKGFPFSGASNEPPTHEVEKLNANGAGGANGPN